MGPDSQNSPPEKMEWKAVELFTILGGASSFLGLLLAIYNMLSAKRPLNSGRRGRLRPPPPFHG